MENDVLQSSAVQILVEESEKILDTLKKQQLTCVTCPIFEEIMDTKLFGFSEKVNFAIELGVIDEDFGQEMLSSLERAMSNVYEGLANSNK